jgi:anti-sigma factor RsiW
MNKHDELKELLPLAAAGALDDEDAAAVGRHIADCVVCGEEFKRWQAMVTHLATLPSPAVPVWLAQKSLQRVRQEREAIEQRRWNDQVLAFLIAFSWVMSLASWPVVNLVARIGLLPWLALSLVLSWITAGSAALILRSHSSFQGRNI